MLTREEAWERGVPLVILLDCGRAMHALEDGGRSKLDHALAAALALLRVAHSRGDTVSVVAFSDRVERVVRVSPAAFGTARAYAALYDLAPRYGRAAYDAAAEAVGEIARRRSTVLLFTLGRRPWPRRSLIYARRLAGLRARQPPRGVCSNMPREPPSRTACARQQPPQDVVKLRALRDVEVRAAIFHIILLETQEPGAAGCVNAGHRRESQTPPTRSACGRDRPPGCRLQSTRRWVSCFAAVRAQGRP
jgi:uncharacterized protein (DUF58 family)